MPQAEQEADPTTPVVTRDRNSLESHFVEQCDHVPGHRLAVVTRAWDLGPPEATQVRADDARVRSDQRDHSAPEVPVLRPPVQQQDRLALARLRHVHAQTSGIDEAMPYARDLGKR